MDQRDCTLLLRGAVRTATHASVIATAAGLTSVKTTAFFGLITTGSTLCPMLIVAYAAGGAALGVASAAAARSRNQREVRKLLQEGKP